MAVSPKPWTISPVDTGSFLDPSDADMCRLHDTYINAPLSAAAAADDDDFCEKLPFSILGNRRFNLPNRYGFLVRSRSVRNGDYIIRRIGDTAASWVLNWECPVSGHGGMRVGMKRVYTLWFGFGYGLSFGPPVLGCWRAEEFVSDRMDGKCSLVAIYSTNDKLKTLELRRTITDYDLSLIIQRNLEKAQKNLPYDPADVDDWLERMGSQIAAVDKYRQHCICREDLLARWVVGDYDPDTESSSQGYRRELHAGTGKRTSLGPRSQIRKKKQKRYYGK